METDVCTEKCDETIELGKGYIDKVTGFCGTATAKMIEVSGQIQIRLEALSKATGGVREEWFKAGRLKRTRPDDDEVGVPTTQPKDPSEEDTPTD